MNPIASLTSAALTETTSSILQRIKPGVRVLPYERRIGR